MTYPRILNDTQDIEDEIIYKILPQVQNCDICCGNIRNSSNDILRYIINIIVIVDYFLNKLCNISNIVQNIRNTIITCKITCLIDCEQKHIEIYVTEIYIKSYINNTITLINNILNGRYQDPPLQTNVLASLAYSYF